jgi:hypothetical protein
MEKIVRIQVEEEEDFEGLDGEREGRQVAC